MPSSTEPAPPRRMIYVGTFLHCVSLTDVEVLEDSAVGVDEDGAIAFIERGPVGPGDEKKPPGWEEAKVVRMDMKGVGFWFPGFVDTHIHAPQFPNAGIFGKSTLLSWLTTYTYPLESSLSSVPEARRVYTHCVRRTLAHGTTTASYFATIHLGSTNLLADICLSFGQRAFVGRCSMDGDVHPDYYSDASAETAMRDTRASIAHCSAIDPGRRLVTPILTPRFAPSCTRPLLQGLGRLHEETGLPIQTHISENPNEIALARDMFPEHESYADTYDAYGLLTEKTVLAHAVHLTPHEVELVRRRKTKVSHCPVSNACIASGICPVRDLLDAGIDVGLGTDVSGGYSPSVLAAAREASSVSRIRSTVCAEDTSTEAKERMKLSPEEGLWMATRGGAKCLGLEKRVGGFEVGMLWDAQFVDLGEVVDAEGEGGRGNVALWGTEGWEERIAKWVFCGDERNTMAVWVAGRLVSGSMDRT